MAFLNFNFHLPRSMDWVRASKGVIPGVRALNAELFRGLDFGGMRYSMREFKVDEFRHWMWLELNQGVVFSSCRDVGSDSGIWNSRSRDMETYCRADIRWSRSRSSESHVWLSRSESISQEVFPIPTNPVEYQEAALENPNLKHGLV